MFFMMINYNPISYWYHSQKQTWKWFLRKKVSIFRKIQFMKIFSYWQLVKKLPRFLEFFGVYHYYRMLGWAWFNDFSRIIITKTIKSVGTHLICRWQVIRIDCSFGGEFQVYPGSPEVYHAPFTVKVQFRPINIISLNITFR